MPPGRDDGDRPSRLRRLRPFAVALLAYVLLFGLVTWQDQGDAPVPVSYTEFSDQVDARNVAEVFARGSTIQGELRAARPVPVRSRSEERRVGKECRSRWSPYH